MTDATQIIKVGLAEIKTAKPPQILRTSGLGSCVGVVVYNEYFLWIKCNKSSFVLFVPV